MKFFDYVLVICDGGLGDVDGWGEMSWAGVVESASASGSSVFG
jgi:hypothetical protein